MVWINKVYILVKKGDLGRPFIFLFRKGFFFKKLRLQSMGVKIIKK